MKAKHEVSSYNARCCDCSWTLEVSRVTRSTKVSKASINRHARQKQHRVEIVQVIVVDRRPTGDQLTFPL